MVGGNTNERLNFNDIIVELLWSTSQSTSTPYSPDIFANYQIPTQMNTFAIIPNASNRRCRVSLLIQKKTDTRLNIEGKKDGNFFQI